MGRKRRPEIDEDRASMAEWTKWRLAGMEGDAKRLAMMMSEADWVAVRALVEEFPEEGLPPSELARRELIVQRWMREYGGSVGYFGVAYDRAWTHGVQLEALRADRDRHPDLYDGEDVEALRGLPWRQALLDSGRFDRRGQEVLGGTRWEP